MKPDLRLAYVPVPDHQTGRSIASTLVRLRLAACANLLGPMTSIYEWEGEECCSEEFLLLLKTSAGRVEQVTGKIVELHPYECPCVVWLDVDAGFPPFLNWVDAQVADQQSESNPCKSNDFDA